MQYPILLVSSAILFERSRKAVHSPLKSSHQAVQVPNLLRERSRSLTLHSIFPRVRRLTLDYGIDASTGQIKGIFQKYRNTLESFTWLGWHSEWYDGKTPSQYEDILSKAGEMLKMVYLEVKVPAYWVDLGILASVAGETPFQFQERRVEALNLVRGIQAD